MRRYRAEIAASEAPSVGIYRKLDHLVCRDMLSLVPRMRQFCKREVPVGVHFFEAEVRQTASAPERPAFDIAETAAKCRVMPNEKEIATMCECCSVMIKGAWDAYIGRDVEGARRVEARDDKVDEAFDSLKIKLSERIRTAGDTEDILNCLMIGKYLERIGDHATNIAEWTNYVVTGKRDESQ